MTARDACALAWAAISVCFASGQCVQTAGSIAVRSGGTVSVTMSKIADGYRVHNASAHRDAGLPRLTTPVLIPKAVRKIRERQGTPRAAVAPERRGTIEIPNCNVLT